MPSRIPTFLLLTLALAALPGSRAGAQVAPLTFELRGGGTVPMEELADPDAGWAGEVGPGASFGMDFAYAFTPHVAGYGGFSQHRFSCSVGGCGRDADLVATGIDAGVRFLVGSGSVVPLVRLGVNTYRVEATAPGAGGDVRSVNSHRSVGLEAGLGVAIRVARNLALVPGARYLRMTSDFGRVGDLPVRTVVVDVGLMIGF